MNDQDENFGKYHCPLQNSPCYGSSCALWLGNEEGGDCLLRVSVDEIGSAARFIYRLQQWLWNKGVKI